jgi:hypothetical protein
MLTHTFSRLFHQFRDPAFICGRFQYATSGTTWTKLTTTQQTSHNSLAVTRRNTGLGTLTFPPCRQACITTAYLEPLGDTIASVFEVKFKLLTPSTGTVDFVIHDNSATAAIADAPDGGILVVGMWVAR